MKEKLISEPLIPVSSTFDTNRMASGEPGLPREFIWHDEKIIVVRVIREWRDTGPCRHGSGDRYIRKHWYEVEDELGRTLKIYFERNPRGKKKIPRWRLFSMTEQMPDNQNTRQRQKLK